MFVDVFEHVISKIAGKISEKEKYCRTEVRKMHSYSNIGIKSDSSSSYKEVKIKGDTIFTLDIMFQN